MERFEYATAADPTLNYCLWEYARTAPAEDKFRSVNLLLRSFEDAGVGDRGYALVEAIRESIGPFRTVFGIKRAQGRWAWEFYFYDYRRTGREVSVGRVLSGIGAVLPCGLTVDERIPYFMFSLDFDAGHDRHGTAIDTVHLYVGNPGSSVSSGIAYAVRAEATELENFYFFFDARRQLAEAAEKIACSPFFDPAPGAVDRVLLPELRDCQTICVANKRGHDCVYFSGVDVDQLLFFLQRFDHPPSVRSFVSDHRADLDHLLFDVGVDYRWVDGRPLALKSGYYGVF